MGGKVCYIAKIVSASVIIALFWIRQHTFLLDPDGAEDVYLNVINCISYNELNTEPYNSPTYLVTAYGDRGPHDEFFRNTGESPYADEPPYTILLTPALCAHQRDSMSCNIDCICCSRVINRTGTDPNAAWCMMISTPLTASTQPS